MLQPLSIVNQSGLFPCVYKLNKKNENKREYWNSNSGKTSEWFLEPWCPKFVLPVKVYGNLTTDAIMTWNRFASAPKGISSIFVGNKGMGKTEATNIISNIAIEHGLPVVFVTNVEYEDSLIDFIMEISDAVIVFDEFGKIFGRWDQQRMLPLFNDLNDKKKLFLITDNNKKGLSEFILDRPGRAVYLFEYDRLPEFVVKEYCEDHNCSEEFMNDMLMEYSKSPLFSMDHLKALVTEHRLYPEYSMKKILEYINIPSLRKKHVFVIEKIISMTGDIYEPTEYIEPYPKSKLDSYSGCSLDVSKKQENNEENNDKAKNKLLFSNSSSERFRLYLDKEKLKNVSKDENGLETRIYEVTVSKTVTLFVTLKENDN